MEEKREKVGKWEKYEQEAFRRLQNTTFLPLFPFSHSFSFSFLCMDAKSCGLLVFCFYLSRASYESPWRLALAVVLGQGMMGERERRRS